MVSQANTNYQQILTQALGQLKGLEAGTGSSESSKNNYSQVAWFKEYISSGQDIEQLVNGSGQQKASAIQNIIKNTVTGLLSLGTGESSKANQETAKNSKNAAELDTKAKQSTQVTEAKVNEILNQISQNKASIEDAIATIQELGGDEGVAGAQEKLQEQLEIIEANKQILNNKEAKPEEKEAALQALEAASGVIAELVGTVNQYQTQIEAQNSTVEATSENIASLTNNAAETITSGIQQLQGFIQSGAAQTATNTAVTAQGGVNTVQGTTATTLGEAINSNAFSAAFSGGEGVKLMMTGSDQTSAGQTRLQGGAQTLAALTKSIGQMGTDISDIANFVNTVGEIGGGISDLVGQYDAEVNPVIVATGSWETVAEANEQLQEALAEYKNPQEENSEDGLTFNFDTNLFQQAFEKQAV